MKQPKMHLVLGPVLHTYPPFTIHQERVEGTGPIPFYVHILRGRAIAMPCRGEEYRITSTYDSRADLPRVIYALQLWLADRPRMIRLLEEHLEFLQRPQEMESLEADLEATREAEKKKVEGDASRKGESRTAITAEQVLAGLRDELERIQQLTYEVAQGLQVLEAAHPEAVAALDKVADEIQRKQDEIKRRPHRRNKE